MEIEDYEDRYRGERIFMVGNGPSLEQTPLDRLSDEYTFAVNNIANIFEETDWRPSFYLAIHSPPNIPEKNVMRVVDGDVPSFFPEHTLDYVPARRNTARVNLEHLANKGDVDVSDLSIDWNSIDDYRDVWSVDASEVVYQYTTVLYPAMQIARYMGFSEFYFVGCDMYDTWDLHMIFEKGDDPALHRSDHDSRFRRIFEFVSSSDHPLRTLVNGLAYRTLNSTTYRRVQPYLANVDDRFANQAHFYDTFDVSEFLAGNEVRNQKMIRSHELAKAVSSVLDFDIYNATVGGHLEVHPRVDIHDVLAE